MNETELMKLIQVAASRLGLRLFRNNCGVAFNRENIPIRFGLCPGSSDLIGFTQVKITDSMVGKNVAIFTAIEVKSKSGKLTKEQSAFLANIDAVGGIAVLARSESDMFAALRSWQLEVNQI